MTFFFLAWSLNFEGMICLIVIIAPFLTLGTLGAFIYRLIKLHNEGKGTKLYISLAIPFLFILFETNMQPADQVYTVKTIIEINANRKNVWGNLKNVKNIQPNEISPHFIHLMGIPKPLNGSIDKEQIGGVRNIVWEKGIKFQEIIKSWDEGKGFSYDIKVNPSSIPPTTLDEHVMIGGKYFDVLEGFYNIEELGQKKSLVTLSCTYRITTNLNFYSKLWADFVISDFNEMILEIIKNRAESNE